MIKTLTMLVVLCAVNLFAEVSIGLDLITNFNAENSTTALPPGDTERSERRVTMGAAPYVMFMSGTNVEIVPTAGFLVSTRSTRTEDFDGDVTRNSSSSWRMWGGCGLFWRLIDGNTFRMSIGPDFHISGGDADLSDLPYPFFGKFSTSVGLPVNIDLRLARRLFLRSSTRLASLTYGFGENGNTRTGEFDFSFRSIFTPRLGFYATF